MRKKLTVDDVVNQKSPISDILSKNRGYRTLQAFRGSPRYWRTTKYDILAMCNILGPPTFFITLSAADLYWPDVLMNISRCHNLN